MLPDYNFSSGLFASHGLELSRETYEKLDIYAEFLVEYNKNVNLTAITEGREILIKHFLDSILISKYVPHGTKLIDVGTGAGFPSVPLRIYRDDIEITLLDSLNKRITFLQLLCEKVGISAEFIHGRAEDFGKNPDYREKFDISCARAVANLAVLGEYCLPFVRVGGHFLSMKGPSEEVENAVESLKKLGGKLSADEKYSVEGDGRRIIDIEKISHTPPKFPRNSAQIKKKPL